MNTSNFSTIVVGHQRCGKTTFAHTFAQAYPRKVLAVSPDDRETIFSPYPDLEEWDARSKIKKVVYQKSLNNSLLKFSRGLMIFDDCRYYISKHDEFFAQMLIRKRQHDRDMIFIVHSMFDFPPALMQFINGIYIYPFFDAPERLKGRFWGWDRFEQVWTRVNQTKVPEYFPIFV